MKTFLQYVKREITYVKKRHPYLYFDSFTISLLYIRVSDSFGLGNNSSSFVEIFFGGPDTGLQKPCDMRKRNQNQHSLLPYQKTLENINYKSIIVGFLLFTVGIITGAVWANYAWGTYWSWDPKETWSLITWIVYAILLHARYTGRLVGRRMAYISIAGFVAVVFTYWGVNYLLSGLHSYAS